jgi:integrase
VQVRHRPYFYSALHKLGRVFDFHALRGQCATLLARRRVHPKIAQVILRHSDVNLTLNLYTRTDQAQKASAVTDLSALLSAGETGVPEPKTGTDDRAQKRDPA